jgi:hypothetical protein
MLFSGSFRIIKKLANTGEVTYDSDWVKNTITKNYLQNEVTGATGIGGSSSSPADERIGPNIVISEWDGPSDEDVTFLHLCHEIGTDVTAPTLNGDGLANPYYVEFQQSYAPPPSNRNINTIGMTGETSVPADGTVQVDAFTKLGTTCTQLTTETLIVFYRVQFLQGTGTGMTAYRALAWAGTIGLGITPDNNPNRFFPKVSMPYWAANLYDQVDVGAYDGADTGYDVVYQYGDTRYAYFSPTGIESTYSNIFSYSSDPTYYARRFPISREVDKEIGMIYGSAMFFDSKNNQPYASAYWNNILPAGQGKVQNIYSHSSAATKPFFDPLTTPTTDGTIAIDSSSWTDPDYPFMYRIDITTSGAVGASEYQFRRRRLVEGFQGNTYFNRVALFGLLSRDNNNNKLNGHNIFGDNDDISGFDNRGETWTVLDNRTFIAADATGVAWVDVINGFMRIFDNSLFGAFGATNITTTRYDDISDTIWVACQDTGIYSINDPTGTPTVTFHDVTGATGGPTTANNAYALDLGQDTGSGYRKVFAIVEGALVESTDNGSTWAAYDSTSAVKTFTNATIEANWDWVLTLRCDRTSANDELAVVYSDNTTAASFNRWVINWWDSVSDSTDPFTAGENLMGTNVTLPVSSEDRRRWQNAISVSPNQSRWAWGPTRSTGVGSTDNGVPVYLTYAQGTAGITSADTPAAISVTNNYSSYVGQHQVWWDIDDNGDDCIFTILQGDEATFIRNDGTFFVFEDMEDTDTDLTNEISFNSSDFKAYFGHGLVFGVDDPGTSFGRRERGVICQLSGPTNDLPLGPSGWEHIIWESYGWNGSAWVLNDPGSKTTHASNDALIDGLTISFDDAGATQNFVATDYFTTGVVDGIWLDGNTEFDFTTTIYTRRVVANQTSFDPGNVPGSTSLALAPQLISINEVDWVDETGGIDFPAPNRVRQQTTSVGGTKGARLNLATEGDGSVRFKFLTGFPYDDEIGNGSGTVVGLSSAGTIGSGLDIDTVQYGFYISGGSTTNVDIDIRESGVNVASIDTGLDVDAILDQLTFRIERDGSDINYYFNEKLVHTTGSVPGGNMIVEVVYGNNAAGDCQIDEWNAVWTDTWSYVGNSGGSTGFYDPNYVITDAGEHFSLQINGVEGTQLLRDRTTVLAAGEYSFFPETGAIRLAAADSGLAITGTYNYLVNN